jgi:hypothetical protein
MPPLRYGVFFFALSACLYLFDVYFWLQHPLEWWLRVVPDDIFYYLQVARNLSATGVSTFDGQTLTNGYHPGWMALLSVISPLFADQVGFFKAALLFSFSLHFLSALVLRWAIDPIAGKLGSWLGACFWLLSPLPLTVAIQGMEGALYELGLWFCVGFFLHLIAPNRSITWRTALGFGVVLAFAFWGRTEGVLLALLSVVWLLVREISNARREGHKFSVKAPAVTFASFALFVMPWPLYSHFATGVWGQQSGKMKTLWASVESSPDVLERILSAIVFFCLWWIGAFVRLFAGLHPAYFWLSIPFIIVLLIAMKKAQWRANEANKLWWQLLSWLAPFWFLVGFVYATLFSDARTWYWASPAVVLVALCWGGLAQIKQLRRLPRLLAGIVVLVFISVVNLRFAYDVPAPYKWQAHAYDSNKWLESYVPEGETLGIWNAGVPAYFGKYPVINLDGLMNNEVVPYWQSRDFGAYLRKKQIRYIIDLPEAIVRVQPFCREPLKLQEVARHDASRRVLWRVLP